MYKVVVVDCTTIGKFNMSILVIISSKNETLHYKSAQSFIIKTLNFSFSKVNVRTNVILQNHLLKF